MLHAGEARVGNIYKDDLAERNLKTGDIYRISAGSAFYMVNTGEGQRLHVICSIDPAESLGLRAFQVCVCVYSIFNSLDASKALTCLIL